MINPTLTLLTTRQSASALAAPGPSAEQLDTMILAASAVPDHGKLRPYRFVVVEESGKVAFGNALATVVDVARGGITDELKDKFRKRTQVAPTQIMVIFSPQASDKAPAWEQQVTASCTGYAIILAATALGLGANWRSSSVMEGAALTELFGMSAEEKLLGWVNVGQIVAAPASPRADVDVSTLMRRI